MPHRQERNGTAGSTASPMYSRVNGLSEEAASRIMRPSPASLYPHSSGVVTPLMGTKPWVTAQHPGLRGMMPVLEKPKSSDSTDRSTATKPDEDCTVATLATEASADDLEKREATANALLLVSTAAVRHDSTPDSSEATAKQTEKEDTDGTVAPNVPLKKRKKHPGFMRGNNDNDEATDGESQPCHISPVSHSSVEGRTVSREEATPERPQSIRAQTERCNSYDSKDSPYQKDVTQQLLDSSKISSAKDISITSRVDVPHFPSVLHQVLSDPEFAGTVVTWLPDGESWKVLRWDALRRQVLPRYFSNLRDEDGSGCGTIDAFLWHLFSWGFEEVKDGSDVGAYRHDLFIRGAQKLSNKMRFMAASRGNAPKAVSPARYHQGGRTMLQVPTLAPVAKMEMEMDRSHPDKRPRYDEQTSAFTHNAIRRTSPGPQNWRGYRGEDPYADGKPWGHYYGEAPRMYPGGMYSDPRYPLHHQRPIDSMGLSSYTAAPLAPQVRSGRGAMRVAGSTRSPPSSSPVNTPPPRSSFPVSNRGKGRKAAICRTPVPSPDAKSAKLDTSSPSPTKAGPVGWKEAQRIGNSVKGVAIAISRKTKRKLPLARNVDKDSDDASSTEKK